MPYEGKSTWNAVIDLLRQSSVQVHAEDWGTGFFVAPRLIVTCAHVVGNNAQKGAKVDVRPGGDGAPLTASVVEILPGSHEDVAVLRLDDEDPEHAVPLDIGTAPKIYAVLDDSDDVMRDDDLLVVGFPKLSREAQRIDALSVTYAAPTGFTDDPAHYFHKFKRDRVVPGFSGSPLLNLRTGRVIGIVDETLDSKADAGGWAVPSRFVLKRFPDLAEANRQSATIEPWLECIRAWQRERDLSKRTAVHGILDVGRMLPDSFVARPDVTAQVKGLLLPAAGPTRMAIIGLPGSGKTTFATDLARDPEIRARFQDGALWVTLGQTPSVLTSLNVWIDKLGGAQAKDPETASQALIELLADRSVLLVVDDAWAFADVQPFLVASPACRILITSRELAVAKQANVVDSAVVVMPVLTQEQSLTLLERKLGRPYFHEAERAQALDVAAEVGYLPLALELAAVQIGDGYSWSEVLDDLRAEIAHLDRLQIPLADDGGVGAALKNQSLLGSFNLTVRRLSEQDRVRFAWLGLTAEDAIVSAESAAVFWNVDARSARDQLTALQYRSLLQVAVRPPTGGFRYQLHDLVRDLARRLLTAKTVPDDPAEIAGLGLTLADGYAEIVRRYRLRTKDGLWHTVPDDAYIHQHLIWHLEQAGAADELHAVLWETTADGRNGWYTAKERLAQTAGYLSDLARVWDLAEADVTSPLQAVLASEIRYALIATSLNSLARNVPPNLVGAFLRRGFWTANQALSNLRRMEDGEPRSAAISAAAPYLCADESSARETLSLVRQSAGPWRVRPLASLAPHLPEAVLSFAWEIAWEDGASRVAATRGLVGVLPESLVRAALHAVAEPAPFDLRPLAVSLLERLAGLGFADEALQAVLQIDDTEYECEALRRIIPHLAEPERARVIPALQAATDKVADPGWRAYQLQAMAQLLPETALQEALDRTKGLPDTWDRGAALISFAPHLSGDQRLSVVAAALDALTVVNRHVEKFDPPPKTLIARSQQDSLLVPPSAVLQATRLRIRQGEVTDYNAGEKRTALRLNPQDVVRFTAPVLSEELLQRVLSDFYLEPSDEVASCAIDVLAELAPYLSPQQVQSVLAAAESIQPDTLQVKVLTALADRFEQAGLDDLVRRTVAIESPCGRAEALADAIASLRDASRETAGRALLDALGACNDDSILTACLQKAAPYFGEAAFPPVLDIVSRVSSDEERRRSLDALGPSLTAALLPAALALAQHIGDDLDRARTTIVLAEYMPQSWPPSVIEAIRMVPSGELANAIRRLVPVLSTPLASEVLERIEAMPSEQRTIDSLREPSFYRDTDNRAEALSAIAARCTPELLATALDIVRRMEAAADFGRSPRAQGLAALAPALTQDLLADAVALAQELPHEPDRSYAIGPLAARMAELGRVSDAVALVRSGSLPAEAVTVVVPLVDPAIFGVGNPPDMVDPANPRKFFDRRRTPHPVTSLVPFLGESELRDVLSRVDEIDDYAYRSEIRAAVAKRLAELNSSQEALGAAKSIEEPSIRCEVLLALAPSFGSEDRASVLNDARDAAEAMAPSLDRAVTEMAVATTLPAAERIDLVQRARGDLASSEDGRDRFDAAVRAIRTLAINDCWPEAVDLLWSIDAGEHDRLMTVAMIVPALPEQLVPETIARVQALHAEPHRTIVLTALRLRSSPLDAAISPNEMATALADVGTMPQNSDFDERRNRTRLVAALFHMLGSTGDPQRSLALAQTIEDRGFRATALDELVKPLVQLAEPLLLPSWRKTLRVSASRRRPDFLSDLEALSVVRVVIGGVDAVRATAEALDTVGRWWS